MPTMTPLDTIPSPSILTTSPHWAHAFRTYWTAQKFIGNVDLIISKGQPLGPVWKAFGKSTYAAEAQAIDDGMTHTNGHTPPAPVSVPEPVVIVTPTPQETPMEKPIAPVHVIGKPNGTRKEKPAPVTAKAPDVTVGIPDAVMSVPPVTVPTSSDLLIDLIAQGLKERGFGQPTTAPLTEDKVRAIAEDAALAMAETIAEQVFALLVKKLQATEEKA